MTEPAGLEAPDLVAGGAAASAPTETASTEAPELISRTTRQYLGENHPGIGCKYSGEEEVAREDVPAGMVVLERQIAHDPTTCTLVVERGFVPLAYAQPDGASHAEADEMAGSSDNLAEQSSNEVSAAAVALRAFHKTYIEDPPGIDVNSIEVQVAWVAGSGCTDSYQSNHLAQWGWYSPTGWARDSYSWSTYKDCGGASTIASGKFSNDIFCAGITNIGLGPIGGWLFGKTTYTEYDPTVIRGLEGGNYYMQWNYWIWGGCANLINGTAPGSGFNRTHGFF